MTTTPRAAAAAALAVLALAGTAACQNDPPEPAPTAVLPTPTAPSSDATKQSRAPTPTTDNEAMVREAAGVYADGFQAFQELSVQGGMPDATEEMAEFYSGEYLDLQVLILKQIYDEDLTQTGESELVALIRSDETIGADLETIQLTACIDFSGVEVTTPDEDLLERGYEVTEDTVTMVRDDNRWTASLVDGRSGEEFTGNCAEVTS